MQQPKKGTKKPGGSYITTDSGRVGRTHGIYGPYESMDTTGYSSGKKDFILKTDYSGYKSTSKKVDRKDVPNVIKAMKSGATKNVKL